MFFNFKSFALFYLVWSTLCIACQPQGDLHVTAQIIPDYPIIAAQAGVSGVVNIQTAIDKNGEVKSAVVISGQPLLRKACENSAKLWKFNTSNDEERNFTIACKFSLVDTAKTKNKKILRTEKKNLSSQEVETIATLDDEIQDCCSRQTSAWKQITHPFRQLGHFLTKAFS